MKVKAEVRDMYFVRSNYDGNSLILEAVHFDEKHPEDKQLETVFHRYETTVKSSYDAEVTQKAYTRFLTQNNTDYKLMIVYFAKFFGVNYKGKTLMETVNLITLKAKEKEKELEEG